MSRPGKRNGYRCFASRRRHGSVRCEISGSGGTSANNSRFLILPDRHSPNLASRILSLCEKRLPGDWLAAFGHPLLLIETFVDPQRFRGTIYQAANWLYLGQTQGFCRTRQGYSATKQSPKKVFVRALQADARALLSRPLLNFPYRTGVPKIMLSAELMWSLPAFFFDMVDPRRRQGRRHRLATVLGHRCCRDLVWDAGLQSHCGLGPKLEPPGARAFWLPSRTGTVPRAKRIHHPRRLDPRRSGFAGSRLATLE